MRWPTSGSALGSAGVSVGAAAVGVTVGGLELAGRPHADIWSNGWIIGSMVVAGLGLVIAGVFFLLDVFARGGGGDRAAPGAGPIVESAEPTVALGLAAASRASAPQDRRLVVDRWRCTTNGFEVPALMRIRDNNIYHPALTRPSEEKPKSVKIGVLVGCEALGDEPATSSIRAGFLALDWRSWYWPWSFGPPMAPRARLRT
jgi:hypothetical protein